ncbi:PCMD domain-containing protein [Carboxylicivirga linearis]|uniref:PCMD domain-containing protein n=1 Tax=Carboxylicivirga linearis TaxID=1628157 RepID=A0ABS5K0P9_9BACT|nr:PCMD domain-containing protein [Carboxylicivirga linearis]MBS2100121.1 PCMD domain-containing protein [Carboxylicivirga linearis]
MKRFIYIIAILLFASCVEEDFFGLSDYGRIKNIVVSNQASNAVIDNSNFHITLEIPGGIDLSAITIQEMSLSSFAVADKKVGDILDLTAEEQIKVTSESGKEYIWTVESYVASATPQITNWQLNDWYQTSKGYYEPGADAASTVWGTGNPGSALVGKYATVPEDFGNDNYGARMETLDNGWAGIPLNTPISAGAIFTGYFDTDKLDPTNPAAATIFGTSFSGRPDMLRFKYSYKAGEVNKDRQGNVLDYPDGCDIYALLEIRKDGKKERLATAWFRSSDTQEEMKTVEMPFYYGELDNSFPDYMMPVDHDFVSADSSSYALPTHISLIATSSFGGDAFEGAIGSTLIIDDLEMVYEEE